MTRPRDATGDLAFGVLPESYGSAFWIFAGGEVMARVLGIKDHQRWHVSFFLYR